MNFTTEMRNVTLDIHRNYKMLLLIYIEEMNSEIRDKAYRYFRRCYIVLLTSWNEQRRQIQTLHDNWLFHFYLHAFVRNCIRLLPLQLQSTFAPVIKEYAFFKKVSETIGFLVYIIHHDDWLWCINQIWNCYHGWKRRDKK